MQILLPNKKGGLKHVEEKLKNSHIVGELSKASKDKKVEVEVVLPKFKVEMKIMLKQYLKSLGMKDMFQTGLADFSGISTAGLYVSDAIQKSFIEVNEKGSEAAAATAVMMHGESAMIFTGERFIADHPFLFFLRDKTTGMLLFQGRVMDPSNQFSNI